MRYRYSSAFEIAERHQRYKLALRYYSSSNMVRQTPLNFLMSSRALPILIFQWEEVSSLRIRLYFYVIFLASACMSDDILRRYSSSNSWTTWSYFYFFKVYMREVRLLQSANKSSSVSSSPRSTFSSFSRDLALPSRPPSLLSYFLISSNPSSLPLGEGMNCGLFSYLSRARDSVPALARLSSVTFIFKSKKHQFLDVGAVSPGPCLHGADVALVGLLHLLEDEGAGEVSAGVGRGLGLGLGRLLPSIDGVGTRGELGEHSRGVEEATVAVRTADALDALHVVETSQGCRLCGLLLSQDLHGLPLEESL